MTKSLICVQCGTRFQIFHITAYKQKKYCSSFCSNKAYRINNPKEKKIRKPYKRKKMPRNYSPDLLNDFGISGSGNALLDKGFDGGY